MSEPLRKRRKRSDDIPKLGSRCCPGMSLVGSCIPGQMGVRRRGGASSVQAPVWNLGTARLDVFDRVLTWSA